MAKGQKTQKANPTRTNRRSRVNPNAGGVMRAPLSQNQSSRQSGANSQTYRESERIGTVAGSTSFGIVNNLAAQPGLPDSFPWLSGHAKLFEKYYFKKLKYRYKNLKGADTDGNVIMSFDYDTLDAPPASAVEMTQSTKWIDGAPWRIFELVVDCSRCPHLFTRTGPVTGADLKTYDFGRLFVAAEGCADSSSHGILEAEYEVVLFDKQPAGSTATPSVQSTSQFNFGTGAAGEGPVAYNETIVNGLDVDISTPGLLACPAGNFIVHVDHCFTAESNSTTGIVSLLKNGVALDPPAKIEWTGYATGSEQNLHLTRVVTCEAGDELQVYSSLSGGTGTTATIADACRISIQTI